ncbi:EamA family transporter RarD [Amylibacter sp. SFDW26]|uniref:EamA family transporter RarD n=1 Tax=Amylibacter sp. SFDW26 TaxID=2652722 RepID=UPI001261EC52|nr:EamA family transporter RarD [Amylibacter sp. SFDW26]KAB7616248.1 EamA family transporter RarD [Amylibacter sp. SFDW26]
MSEQFKGIAAMVLACTIWGLSALYYREIAHVPPLEVLSHRTIWSLVFLLVLLSYSKRLGEVAEVLCQKRALFIIAIAALMISVNWFAYILSVQIGRLVESSLGYYIFPLVAVALGYLFLGERLSRLQWVAVSMALIAVVLLTLGLGVAPWISLILAITMGLYGLSKKSLSCGPVLSVMCEVILLAPLALIWLYGVHELNWQGLVGREGGFFGHGWDTVLLMLVGPLTAGPLVLMSYSMKRLALGTVGLVQYLNPTLQFGVSVLIFMEPFTQWHFIAFAIIWTALGLYSYQSLRKAP